MFRSLTLAEHFFEHPALYRDTHETVQRTVAGFREEIVHSYELPDVFEYRLSEFGVESYGLLPKIETWCLDNLGYIPHVGNITNYVTYDGQVYFYFCRADFHDIIDATLFRVAWKS